MLEYASPGWANFLEYLSLLIEGVQKKALEIICPGLPYGDGLGDCSLCTLSDRHAEASTKFIQRVLDTGVLATVALNCVSWIQSTFRHHQTASLHGLYKLSRQVYYIWLFLVKCFMLMYTIYVISTLSTLAII